MEWLIKCPTPMLPSSLTYCHKGFERPNEEFSEEDIEHALKSALTKYVVFHDSTFQILCYDSNYMLSNADLEKATGKSP